MKNFYLVALLILCHLAMGQSRMVAKQIEDFNSKNLKFENFNLFTKSVDQKSAKYRSSASDVSVLDLNESELFDLVRQAPNLIQISVPYQDETIEVQLYKQNVLTDDFKIVDESGNYHDYTPGKYYRGIVSGDETSLVALSFFKDNVIGVISSNDKGNVVVGKSTDREDYISYSDRNLMGENPFVCGVEHLEYNQNALDEISFDPSDNRASETDNCVRLYYEIAYQPYVQNDSSIPATLDWITGIQNNIGTLYDNDGINIAISMVKIWTYADSYSGSYEQILNQFMSHTTEFDGDIAHLINWPEATSAAYVNALCTDWNYAYSAISKYYEEVPTYSWTIMVMSHEMGHSFGSPHTHNCSWNGNNTAIDGCGPSAGYSEGCTGEIPEEGGTIMSYCHLTWTGINLNLGFGDQPAALIRNNINSKPCLSSDCVSDFNHCSFSVESLRTASLTNDTFQIEIIDQASQQWKYRVYPMGENPNDEWVFTDSSIFTIGDLTPHLYHEIEVVNVCDEGIIGNSRKTILLPGDFCDGTLFTDTGGQNGTYSANEHFIKTFYPSSPGDFVTLRFEKYGIQSNVDFLYVYDGDSTDAELFEGGTITGTQSTGPSFTSTHPTGAITIEFISNATLNLYGWEAYIECSALGIEEMSESFDVSVYPNPASDLLNIQSPKSKIQTFSLTDASGRVVMSKQLANHSGSIHIGHLPKGVYILTLKLDKQTVTKKIVKK